MPSEPTLAVPKKDVILVLPYLGFHSAAITRRFKSCVNKFYGLVKLRVVFQDTRSENEVFLSLQRLFQTLAEIETEHFKALTRVGQASAVADHSTSTGHNIKRDHFEILASGQYDLQCKIKETLLKRDLKSALNENVGSEKLFLY